MLPRLFVFALCLLSPSAQAQEPVTPDFEVKFPLNPAMVLGAGQEPTPSAREAFGLNGSVTKLRMLFLDSKNLSLHNAGWDVRVRKIEGMQDVEFTYKRRYPFGESSLATILAQAARGGFDAREKKYKAQVEWGLNKRTLSLARKKLVKVGGLDAMELPGPKKVRELSADKIPDKLNHLEAAGWARKILEDAKVYGPVRGRRWAGELDGLALDFEVWDILTEDGQDYEPIVELSFKAGDENKAASKKQDLIDALSHHQGWLLRNDILKTELILKRY